MESKSNWTKDRKVRAAENKFCPEKYGHHYRPSGFGSRSIVVVRE